MSYHAGVTCGRRRCRLLLLRMWSREQSLGDSSLTVGRSRRAQKTRTLWKSSANSHGLETSSFSLRRTHSESIYGAVRLGRASQDASNSRIGWRRACMTQLCSNSFTNPSDCWSEESCYPQAVGDTMTQSVS